MIPKNHSINVVPGIKDGTNNGINKWNNGVLNRDWVRQYYWLENTAASGVCELRRVGVDAASLRRGGYTAVELLKAGYTAGELLQAGFSMDEIAEK